MQAERDHKTRIDTQEARRDTATESHESGTYLTHNQRSILHMQQTAGNAAVRDRIQRDPPPTPAPLPLNPRAADAPRRFDPLAPLTYSQMNAILNPPGPRVNPTGTPAIPGATPATTATAGAGGESAVEGTITVTFNARHRVAGTGTTPPTTATLSTETETTGTVAPGVEVTHTGSDDGHQFGVSLQGTVGGRAAPELSAEGSIQLDPTGTRVTSIEVRGGAEWTRNYLNNMLRIQGFVRMLVQAEAGEGGTVAASAPVSLTPSATASTGMSARLRIGGTTIRGAGSVAVEIPSHEVTTTFSAEVSQRLFGPLALSLRGERRDTFGAGDHSGRTTGTLGLTIGDPDGTNLRLGAGVESNGSQTGLTGGAVFTGHF
jgi:hypothetical protein